MMNAVFVFGRHETACALACAPPDLHLRECHSVLGEARLGELEKLQLLEV